MFLPMNILDSIIVPVVVLNGLAIAGIVAIALGTAQSRDRLPRVTMFDNDSPMDLKATSQTVVGQTNDIDAETPVSPSRASKTTNSKSAVTVQKESAGSTTIRGTNFTLALCKKSSSDTTIADNIVKYILGAAGTFQSSTLEDSSSQLSRASTDWNQETVFDITVQCVPFLVKKDSSVFLAIRCVAFSSAKALTSQNDSTILCGIVTNATRDIIQVFGGLPISSSYYRLATAGDGSSSNAADRGATPPNDDTVMLTQPLGGSSGEVTLRRFVNLFANLDMFARCIYMRIRGHPDGVLFVPSTYKASGGNGDNPFSPSSATGSGTAAMIPPREPTAPGAPLVGADRPPAFEESNSGSVDIAQYETLLSSVGFRLKSTIIAKASNTMSGATSGTPYLRFALVNDDDATIDVSIDGLVTITASDTDDDDDDGDGNTNDELTYCLNKVKAHVASLGEFKSPLSSDDILKPDGYMSSCDIKTQDAIYVAGSVSSIWESYKPDEQLAAVVCRTMAATDKPSQLGMVTACCNAWLRIVSIVDPAHLKHHADALVTITEVGVLCQSLFQYINSSMQKTIDIRKVKDVHDGFAKVAEGLNAELVVIHGNLPAISTPPAISTQEPAISTQQPAISTQEPAISTQQPATENTTPPHENSPPDFLLVKDLKATDKLAIDAVTTMLNFVIHIKSTGKWSDFATVNDEGEISYASSSRYISDQVLGPESKYMVGLCLHLAVVNLEPLETLNNTTKTFEGTKQPAIDALRTSCVLVSEIVTGTGSVTLVPVELVYSTSSSFTKIMTLILNDFKHNFPTDEDDAVGYLQQCFAGFFEKAMEVYHIDKNIPGM